MIDFKYKQVCLQFVITISKINSWAHPTFYIIVLIKILHIQIRYTLYVYIHYLKSVYLNNCRLQKKKDLYINLNEFVFC